MRISVALVSVGLVLLTGCQNPIGRASDAYTPPTAATPRPGPMDMAPAWAAQSEYQRPAPVRASAAKPRPALVRMPAPQTPAARWPAPPPTTAGGLPLRSDLPFDAVLAEARAKGRPVLIYFETQRCGWCDRLKRETFTRPEVKSRFDAGFVAVRYDAGHAPGNELAKRYGMPGYPVIVITNAAGTEMGRVVGYREAGALLGELARY